MCIVPRARLGTTVGIQEFLQGPCGAFFFAGACVFVCVCVCGLVILKWRLDVPALGSAACLMGMLAAIVRCDMRDLRWLRMIMRALLNRALFG